MEKNLAYYMKLNYPIELVKIKEEEGGGYQASIPMLGKYAFVGDGETREEAISNLEEVKKELFKKYLKERVLIPEPDKYSGRFVLRIPSDLHRFLSMEAKRNETTLNQYCIYILNQNSLLNRVNDNIKNIKMEMKTCLSFINYINVIEFKIDKLEATGFPKSDKRCGLITGPKRYADAA